MISLDGNVVPEHEEDSRNSTTPKTSFGDVESTEARDAHVVSGAVPTNDPQFVSTEGKSFLGFFVTARGPLQIFQTTVILALALGSTIGVVPTMMTDRYARLHYGFDGETSCGSYEVEDKPEACVEGSEDAQRATAVAQLITCLLTFVMSSLMGSISDSRGRKYILALSTFLSIIAPLVLVLMEFYESLDPFWFFFGKCMTGFINVIAIVTSSLSDVVPPVWRAPTFGVIMAGNAVGFVFSPLFALKLGEVGVSIFSLTLSITAFLMAMFYVPETLPKERSNEVLRIRLQEHDSGPVHYGFLFRGGQLCHSIIRPFRELSILNRDKMFRRLTVLASVSSMLISVDQSLLLYYVEDQLGLNDSDVANLYVILGILGILVQGFFLKLLKDRVGERLVLLVAFFAGVVHNILYGCARSKEYIYVGIAFAPLLAMTLPTISAIKSNNVDVFQQGRIQGALFSVASLSNAVGPIVLTYIYHATKDFGYPAPGAFWLLGSFLYFIGCFIIKTLPKEHTDSISVHEEDTDVDVQKLEKNDISIT